MEMNIKDAFGDAKIEQRRKRYIPKGEGSISTRPTSPLNGATTRGGEELVRFAAKFPHLQYHNSTKKQSEKKTKATREILTKIIDRNSFVAEAASRLATWQVNRGVSGHEQSRHQQRRRTSGGEGELGDRAGALLRKEKRRRRRVGRQSRRIVDE
nr:hypothetical protein Iba_chr04bCG9450 [Ipomoea batatas]GMC86098.1 hypothetical protein Iba_chr04dCG7720 [Ipomoea batatas]